MTRNLVAVAVALLSALALAVGVAANNSGAQVPTFESNTPAPSELIDCRDECSGRYQCLDTREGRCCTRDTCDHGSGQCRYQIVTETCPPDAGGCNGCRPR